VSERSGDPDAGVVEHSVYVAPTARRPETADAATQPSTSPVSSDAAT